MYWLCALDKHTGKSSFLTQLWWQERADFFSFLSQGSCRQAPACTSAMSRDEAVLTGLAFTIERAMIAVTAPFTSGAWGPPAPLPAQGRLRLCCFLLITPKTLRQHRNVLVERYFPLASCYTGALQSTIPFQVRGKVLVLTVLNRMVISIETILLPLAWVIQGIRTSTLFNWEGPNICISMGSSRYRNQWKASAGVCVGFWSLCISQRIDRYLIQRRKEVW